MDREESAEIAAELDEQEEADPPASEGTQAAQTTPGDRTEPSVQSEEQASNLMIPVLGVSASDLTDNFEDERGGGTRLHEAIDIMAEAGTSVVSVAPGTVERLFRSDQGGNTVYIRSEDRETIYYYAHLDEYAPGLNEGMTVRRGQRLGTVGSSGNADPEAPHLHFEVMRTTAEAEWWEPSTSVNPYPLLTRQRRQALEPAS
ncbi:M23 family metallopeptidase [Aurantiacibacter aquimixticola]|uniref:M23 family metallopeptidase n=2 Tax=Aurantiacibacter aquimixticola TaxID=1958945 RepID=A0A419RWN9_9SPHN|nr:M23 family metallopeptidase [Aurantiacibacter aquimixticola]